MINREKLVLRCSICCAINILLALVFQCSSLYAQLIPKTTNFSKQIYNAHNQNWMVSQSSNGKMYFANTDGLLEYDGIKWQLFQLARRQVVRSVNCDKKGLIFTGAYEDFGYWKQNIDGHLTYHTLVDSTIQVKLKHEEIWNIVLFENHVIFQSFSSFFVYDYVKVTELKPPGNIMFAHAIHGELLVQIIDSGIYKFRPDGGFQLLPSTLSLANKKVVSIQAFGTQKFIVATENHGVYIYQNGQLTEWKNKAQPFLKIHQLNKALVLANNDIAFGTISNGVYILNSKGEIVSHIDQKNALQNNTVLALYEDQAHNLWCGLDNGIDAIDLHSSLHFYISKAGLEGAIYDVCFFENNVYLATNQGVYVKPWKAFNEFNQSKDFKILEGSQGQAWDLSIYGRQLLCGHNEGTFLIEKNKFIQVSNVNGGYCFVSYPDDKNVLLQGTYTGIVVLVKNKHGRWTFSHRIEGFSEPIKSIIPDNVGSFWLVNPIDGLHKVKISADLQTFDDIKSIDLFVDNLAYSSSSITIYNGKIFIASGNGYLIFDQNSESFQPYHKMPFHSSAYKIIQFGSEYFNIYPSYIEYIGNNQHLNFEIKLIRDYERIIQLDNGQYLFCLENGFAVFDPHQAVPPLSLPAPKISWIEVVNDSQKIRLNTNVSHTTLKASQNNLSIHFYHPVYQPNNDLSYQLAGYDSLWHTTEGRSFKTFNHLSSGSYVFKLKSNLTDTVVTFPFTISPKWYNTPWMWLLYFCGLVMISFLLYRLHLYRLNKERLVFEEEHERMLREQLIKANNEKLNIELINKTKELANSTIGLIHKNEILQKVKTHLLKLQKEHKSNIPSGNFQKVLNAIDIHITSEKDWEIFETNFNQVHEHFLKKLTTYYPDLTPGDLKLSAYLKMNLSSKEIAQLLNISIRGVENKRYRLRKKIDLPISENLTEFMISF